MKAWIGVMFFSLCGLSFAQDPVNFKVIEMPAEFTTIHEYKVMTVRTDADWQAYWNRYVHANVEDGQGGWKPMALPKVDFKQFEIVAVHLGTQPDAGMKVSVQSVVIQNDSPTVTIKESYRGGPVAHHSSNPALLIQIPKASGNVSVVLKKDETTTRIYGVGHVQAGRGG